MFKKFISRKLIVTMATLITVISGIPIPAEALDLVVQLAMVYVGGQSVVDSVEKYTESGE